MFICEENCADPEEIRLILESERRQEGREAGEGEKVKHTLNATICWFRLCVS